MLQYSVKMRFQQTSEAGSIENAGPEKTKKRAGGNWKTTVAQKLQIVQLRREKQRESIKSHDEHFAQTRYSS